MEIEKIYSKLRWDTILLTFKDKIIHNSLSFIGILHSNNLIIKPTMCKFIFADIFDISNRLTCSLKQVVRFLACLPIIACSAARTDDLIHHTSSERHFSNGIVYSFFVLLKEVSRRDQPNNYLRHQTNHCYCNCLFVIISKQRAFVPSSHEVFWRKVVGGENNQFDCFVMFNCTFSLFVILLIFRFSFTLFLHQYVDVAKRVAKLFSLRKVSLMFR